VQIAEVRKEGSDTGSFGLEFRGARWMWGILGYADRGRARGTRTQRAGLRWWSSPRLEDKEFSIPKLKVGRV